MKMWRVKRTWYVEAETYADALLACQTARDPWMPRLWRRRVRAGRAVMTDASAHHILAAECCNGTGQYAGLPCPNPRCPIVHPDKYVQG